MEQCWKLSSSRRYMKSASTIKYINTSIMCSQNGNMDSVKALVHNTAFLWLQKND